MRQAVESQLNALRAAARNCGGSSYAPARPLRWNQKLYQTGTAHAFDMAQRGYFAHSTPEGRTPSQRSEAFGYDWALYGENIAAGQTSIAAALNSWLASPPHCRAIMTPDFRDAALSCVPGPDGLLWALELGQPR